VFLPIFILLVITAIGLPLYFATRVQAVSTNVVISEFRVRGPNGAADEFIELYNLSASPVAIGGWKIRGSNATAGVSDRATITAGTILQPRRHYLITNSSTSGGPYSGSVPGNQTFTVGITDDGGIALTLPDNTVVDQVGMSAGSAFKEGTPLANLGTSNLNRGYERKPGGANGSTTDTDNNATDFQLITPSDPQNLSSPPTPADGNQPISPTCPGSLTTAEGTATSAGVSATDPDGTVTSAAITSAAVPGITLDGFTPAAGVGGTANATLNVANTTAPGTYNVVIQYSNNDSPTPQTATCTVVVNVNPPPTPAAVVISQVYGGGGNTGATLKNDYIELINHSGSPVNLNGWSVQALISGTWQVTPLTNFTLQPGQYYLVQESQGAGGTDNLPTPDAIGTITVSSTSSTVALVNNTTTLTGACPNPATSGIVDLVGYGTATCFEGAAAAPLLNNTTSDLRRDNGCFDTDDNARDFVSGGPNPRNSSSPFNSCTVIAGYGTANPNPVLAGTSTTLTVHVAPAQDPTSTGLTVTADLSQIGGSASQAFSGGPNTFTFVATIPANNSTGMKSLPVTIADLQSRTANTNIIVSVLPLIADHVTISQLYGGGSNSGSTYSNDYVELYNPHSSAFDLTGWSLQYTSAAGDVWQVQPLGGSIGPGEYYLIGLAAGTSPAGTIPLPPANINGDINMSATTGKVALVNSFDELEGPCPLGNASIVDFLGYGTSANCAETTRAAAPSNTTSLFRQNGGAKDSDNNSADFSVGAPNPRQTALIVEIGPEVFSTDPRKNAATAPRDATIAIDFTEPVTVDNGWYDISCVSSGNHNSATVRSFFGNETYTITPNVNFTAAEQCTVTIFKDAVHDVDTDDSGPNTDSPHANKVFSFTVATGTAPPYPSSVHLTMGNPTGATTDLGQPNNYLMEKPEFALSYNRDRGTPNWVGWHLSDDWIGTLARVDTFRADPAVPADWYRVSGFDYVGSGFDRGHMTPNADRDKQTSVPINQATFLMSNMLPQAPNNNQGPWANLEDYLRTQIPANEIYIVAGGAGTGGVGSNSPAVVNTIANGNITVPAQTWKVALIIPKDSGDDVSRVTCGSRTLAVIMPNVQGLSTNWEDFITTVDAVETLTGYNFFSNLPDAVENCVEAGTNGTNVLATANQSASTQEDNAVQITLEAARPDADPITFSIVNGPTNGSLGAIGAPSCTQFACSATVTYTPGSNYNGSDSFTFKVSDGTNNSNTSTVSITINSVNDLPVATADSYSTDSNVTLNVAGPGVLSNDNDPVEGSSLSAVLVTDVTHGTLTLNPDGSFSYEPDLDFEGTDSFTYHANDGSDNSNDVTVTITVNDKVPPVLTSSVAMSVISANNSNLFNVGLAASATDNSGDPVTITVAVVGDENDETPTNNGTIHSPDAKDIAPSTLRLRGERVESGDGRVYLIIVTATDSSGNVTRNYHTVVVPKGNNAAKLAEVNAQAAAAVSYAQANNGATPPGYFVIGDGPIVGPKQ
jgi:endonuclease G